METRWEKDNRAWWRTRVVFVPDVTPVEELAAQLPRLRALGVGAVWLKEATDSLLKTANAHDIKILLSLPHDGDIKPWQDKGVAGFDLGDLSGRKLSHDDLKALRATLAEDVLLCAGVSKGGPKRAAAFVRWENEELHIARPVLKPSGDKRLFKHLSLWQRGLSHPMTELAFPPTDNAQLAQARLLLALSLKGLPVLRESVFPLMADEELATFAQKLLALRAGSDALQLGGFWPLQNDSRIIRFARRFNGNPLKRAFLGGEKKDAVGVAVNLSPRRVAVPILGRVLLGNSTRQTADCELGPYEALILEWHIEEIKTK